MRQADATGYRVLGSPRLNLLDLLLLQDQIKLPVETPQWRWESMRICNQSRFCTEYLSGRVPSGPLETVELDHENGEEKQVAVCISSVGRCNDGEELEKWK